MSHNRTKENDIGQFEPTVFEGIYPVSKARGETLAALLMRFRKEHILIGDTKLTYAGRLDPMAEGLVLVLAGNARFMKDEMLGLPKTYVVEILLGVATDTQDVLGLITNTSIKPMNNEMVTQSVAALTSITSLPYPLYSSVPVDGKPLFVHARAGTKVSVPEKKVAIYSAEHLDIRREKIGSLAEAVLVDIQKVQGDFRQDDIAKDWERLTTSTDEVSVVTVEISASSGTYMRSLSSVVGEHLGVPALAYTINRIQIGEYKIS